MGCFCYVLGKCPCSIYEGASWPGLPMPGRVCLASLTASCLLSCLERGKNNTPVVIWKKSNLLLILSREFRQSTFTKISNIPCFVDLKVRTMNNGNPPPRSDSAWCWEGGGGGVSNG